MLFHDSLAYDLKNSSIQRLQCTILLLCINCCVCQPHSHKSSQKNRLPKRLAGNILGTNVNKPFKNNTQTLFLRTLIDYWRKPSKPCKRNPTTHTIDSTVSFPWHSQNNLHNSITHCLKYFFQQMRQHEVVSICLRQE